MQAFFQEIRIFALAIMDWIILVLIFTFFFLACNATTVTLFGRHVIVPIFSDTSFAANFFSMLVSDIAPPHIPLVVTTPMAAFIVQFKLAFLLSTLFTLPVLFARLIAYFSPALYAREMRIVYILLAPLTILFFSGVVFAYFYIAPATFKLLYAMATPIGVTPMLEVSEFINITGALLFATGAAFTIPVFMVLLTVLGAIPASFWRKNTRFAIILFLIVSAIITPDGTGVSMILLSLPVSALYGAGVLVSTGVEKRRGKKDVPGLSVN